MCWQPGYTERMNLRNMQRTKAEQSDGIWNQPLGWLRQFKFSYG